ncbi:MAG: flavin monoamine oxidase family protein [Paracoccaceae bacterium]
MFHNRRTILAGLAATAASPLFATTPTNPDVVIVGAGAAGLSAGQELRRRGISFVIVEAADRVGGRAWTESVSFGQPVDHGCSWINRSNRNPVTDLARNGGFTLVNHTHADTDLFDINGRRAGQQDQDQIRSAWDAVANSVSEAGQSGYDIPASHVVSDIPYAATVRTWLGAMDYGMDFDQISTRDYWDSDDDQPSHFVREGLGTVIARQAEGLPIRLGTQVTAVDWSGSGVSVETSAGTIRARACVLTVSVGVLASGAIRFTPALPPDQQQAVSDIPMGLLVKIPLLFDGARLGLGENNWVTYRVPEDQPGRACYAVAWPCGWDYLMGFVGGRFTWELWRDGQGAVVDFALEQLVRLLGSDVKRHFVKGFATDWADNPLTRGAYGAVRPGAYGAREILGRPVGRRVFIAGEAVAGSRSALVNGAWISGRKTAQKVAKMLR